MIGIGYKSNKKELIQENITKMRFFYSPEVIAKHENIIYSIQYIPETDNLFAIDSLCISQYQRDAKQWKLLKKYKNLGLGSVISCSETDKLVIFAGDGNIIRVVNSETLEQFEIPIKSAVKFISSIQACRVSNRNYQHKKYMLCLTGSNPDYSEGQSDVFDISDLVENIVQGNHCIRKYQVQNIEVLENSVLEIMNNELSRENMELKKQNKVLVSEINRLKQQLSKKSKRILNEDYSNFSMLSLNSGKEL